MRTYPRADASLLRYTLDTPVGGSGVSAVDIVLVDLEDSDGASGLGFSYVIGGHGGDVVLAASFNRAGFGPNLVALAFSRH